METILGVGSIPKRIVFFSNSMSHQFSVMSSGNVTLHPFNSGATAMLRACPERAERVERETSLDISEETRTGNTKRFLDLARNDKGLMDSRSGCPPTS